MIIDTAAQLQKLRDAAALLPNDPNALNNALTREVAQVAAVYERLRAELDLTGQGVTGSPYRPTPQALMVLLDLINPETPLDQRKDIQDGIFAAVAGAVQMDGLAADDHDGREAVLIGLSEVLEGITESFVHKLNGRLLWVVGKFQRWVGEELDRMDEAAPEALAAAADLEDF